MTSILEKQQAERLQKAVHTLQKKPENKTCFDCGALVRRSRGSLARK